jgi:hypothetical protein
MTIQVGSSNDRHGDFIKKEAVACPVLRRKIFSQPAERITPPALPLELRDNDA